jgi:vWA domain found in the FtsH ternary systems/N-terminal helical region fused to the FtsH ternary system vWA domain
MDPYELRDLDEARRFLLQGLWWQRVLPPTAATVRPALEWALEIASEGQPLPPLGFVADLGHLAFGLDWESRTRPSQAVPSLPMPLVRTYEDHVLGKICTDWSFARASDALRQPRYQGRDRARGLAFLVNQFGERAGFAGVALSFGVIKTALETAPEEVLNQGWESLRQDGAQPLLADLYEALIAAARRTAEVLGQEDLFELERGTALAEMGERVALRQVLQAAAKFEATLPRHRLRPRSGRQEVPTRILDEDTYPVGGFTSLSTRGSVESLLHSQLAFMEEDERPDLFDIKFVRDELLYYSRDENQFLRRRRTFVFALAEDLIATRYKETDLPYQQGVLLLALIVVVVRKLSEWLSTDALAFKIVFLVEKKEAPLEAERALLHTLLDEPIANGTVEILREKRDALGRLCTNWARRSLCHCATFTCGEPLRFEAADTVLSLLRLHGSRPALGDSCTAPAMVEGDDALDSWNRTLELLLQRWI